MARRTPRPASAPEIEPLVTARYVMARLGCSRSWVQDHRAELGARKLGGLLLFERAELEAWIARSRVAEPAPSEQPEPRLIRPSVEMTGLPEKNPLTGRDWPWNRAGRANR
jgi:predicted DNA-binding transcriptional regulator AlpA